MLERCIIAGVRSNLYDCVNANVGSSLAKLTNKKKLLIFLVIQNSRCKT